MIVIDLYSNQLRWDCDRGPVRRVNVLLEAAGGWLLSRVRRAWIKAEWWRDGGAKGEGVITSPPQDFYWPINIDLCLMPSHIWIAGMRTGCTSWLDNGFMRSARTASACRGSCKPSRKLSLVPFIYTEFITLTSMRWSLKEYYLQYFKSFSNMCDGTNLGTNTVYDVATNIMFLQWILNIHWLLFWMSSTPNRETNCVILKLLFFAYLKLYRYF